MTDNTITTHLDEPIHMTTATDMAIAITEAIREAGEIPSGTLYAILCGHLSIDAFEALVVGVIGSGLVENKGGLLRWVGPKICDYCDGLKTALAPGDRAFTISCPKCVTR